MAKLNSQEKLKLRAVIAAFDYSGFDVKIVGNICSHHQSFVGRDYKAFAQMAPFIVYHFVSSEEIRLWLCLSKVSVSEVIWSLHTDCYLEIWIGGYMY